jgi:hypothetical protein
MEEMNKTFWTDESLRWIKGRICRVKKRDRVTAVEIATAMTRRRRPEVHSRLP